MNRIPVLLFALACAGCPSAAKPRAPSADASSAPAPPGPPASPGATAACARLRALGCAMGSLPTCSAVFDLPARFSPPSSACVSAAGSPSAVAACGVSCQSPGGPLDSSGW
jgi:hypothetical protein